MEKLPADQAQPLWLNVKAEAEAKLAPLMLHKVDKQSVSYSRGHRDAHCGRSYENDTGYCRHFVEPSNPASQTGDGAVDKD
jgi:hypothetical protein